MDSSEKRYRRCYVLAGAMLFVCAATIIQSPAAFAQLSRVATAHRRSIQPGSDYQRSIVAAPQPRSDSIGVVVGDPVVISGTAQGDNKAFAAGIGWYLTDAVAGTPEFGQTPLRATVDQIASERNIAGTQVAAPHLVHLARIAGANRVAAGTIAERPGGITVSYTLLRVSDDREAKPIAIGSPVIVSAKDRNALVANLPRFAERIRIGLGERNSSITPPPLTGVTSDVLTELGACLAAPNVTWKQVRDLDTSGSRLPIVAEYALSHINIYNDPTKTLPFAELLLNAAPRDTQAVGILTNIVSSLIGSHSQELYAMSESFPRNAILADASSEMEDATGDSARSYSDAARAVVDAPANPFARTKYSWQISVRAERIRHSRLAEDMSKEEWQTIRPLYQRWRDEALAATLCDPLYGYTWVNLASAATFAGDTATADWAMTQARKINRRDPYDTYSWALEMYAPKWRGETPHLAEVANEAAVANYPWNFQKLAILAKFGDLKLTQQKQRMEQKLLRECAATLSRDPKDLTALQLRIYLYDEMGTPQLGATDSELYAKLAPDDPSVLQSTGERYTAARDWPKAEEAFRKSLALRPDDANTLTWMGNALLWEGRYDEAASFLQRCLQLQPNYTYALSKLGDVYLFQSKYTDAITLLKHALQSEPADSQDNVNLAICYSRSGQDEEAIRVGTAYLRYAPKDADLWRTLSDSYLHLSRWTEAEKAARQSLAADSSSAPSYVCLGNALIGQNKRDEARKAWQQAVTIGTPKESIDWATSQLSKYPAP